MTDEETLAALNTQLAGDPQWQALVQNFKQSGMKFMGHGQTAQYSQSLQPFREYAKAKGIDIPDDYSLDPTTGTYGQSWTNSTGGAAGLSALEFAAMLAGGEGLVALEGPAASAGAGVGADTLGDAWAAAPATAGGAGTAATAAAGPSTASILSQIGKAAGAVGQGVGAATDQAAKNRIAQNDPYVSRARLDDTERNQALKDIYAANRMMNPTNSQFDRNPMQAPTGDLAAALAAVSSQDTERLKKPGQYNATTLPPLTPSTLEQVGDWVSPALSVLSTIGKYYR